MQCKTESPVKNVWTGNGKIFRAYFHGSEQDEGKKPAERVKNQIGHEWKTVEHDSCFGAVLNPGFIDISFDSKEMFNAVLNMAEQNGWKCLALPSTHGGHTYWKKPKGFGKDGKDIALVVGFKADIHSGSTYIPLCVHGEKRFPPEYDILDGEDYQEVPEELWPVVTRDGNRANYKTGLWGLKSGDGRNSALSAAVIKMVHDSKFTSEQIKRIVTNTNEFVFKEPLSNDEMNTILRDETFRDIQETEFRPIEGMSAAELMNTDIKPVEFIVNGLLPVGLNILASPPKYGKSFMCMDLALSVASGRDFLGYTTNKNPVLYLALEDRYDRLKERIEKLLDNEPAPENMILSTDSATLDTGFIEQLEECINRQNIKLIIVDTFIKVRGVAKRNESAYTVDSREAGTIKKFADQHGVSILLVTHTRKGIDMNDPFSNITGTYGIAGAADDMIVLTKDKRSDNLTKMSVTGRDVQYEEIPIVFDKDHGKWNRQADSYDAVAADVERAAAFAKFETGNLKKTIMRLLEDNGGIWKGSCSSMINASKKYGSLIEVSSRTLTKELRLINDILYSINVIHTEIKNGTGGVIHQFELRKRTEDKSVEQT